MEKWSVEGAERREGGRRVLDPLKREEGTSSVRPMPRDEEPEASGTRQEDGDREWVRGAKGSRPQRAAVSAGGAGTGPAGAW